MLILLLLLIQTTAPGAIPEYAIPAGTAGLVLWFWRQDRRDREVERKAQEERYAALAEDFRKIVQESTEAVVELREAIKSGSCPFGGRLAQVESSLAGLSSYTHQRVHELANHAQVKLSRLDAGEQRV